MKAFTPKQELASRSMCDHDCIFTGTVISRTARTVTVKTRMSGEKRCGIHLDDEGNEFCFPHGRYSMAPIFRA